MVKIIQPFNRPPFTGSREWSEGWGALPYFEGGLTLFRSLGVKVAEDGLTFAAAAFGALIFALLSILHA
jgi:hypothetical protein